MLASQHGQIVSFIWRIADDVLRDVYVRGKYRDVILPMTVIRRLDAVLEPNKSAVLERKAWADQNGIRDADQLLKEAAGHPFYNISNFTLRQLLNSPANLQPNFIAYLDGFSPNVVEILQQFEFRNQLPRLAKEDRIGPLIKRFVDPDINLSPRPSGSHPGLDNHTMGTIFEELIRRFNEENNEEAGEHFTPRDVVQLMADLVLTPVAETLTPGLKLIYDGACGTGGMLTVAEERLDEIATRHGKKLSARLYGQEVNGETWAISQADQLIKGESAEGIAHGSTLAADAFPSREFDFMLSNPPYGKGWKADLDRLGGKDTMHDPRFMISFAGNPEYSLITRSSDGQMMFLANLLAKMKNTPEGSRIAEIHNGSSLFTGDAGQGESNIRRWIIESDWLEAIIALPNNMFYNTGIATYIWVISNRKSAQRQGKVQLIDATKRFTPRRKNLGSKNADLSDADIAAIMDEFLAFEESETSKIFPNAAFGYWKVTVDRPLRLRVDIPQPAKTAVRADQQAIPGDLKDRIRSVAPQLSIGGRGPFMSARPFTPAHDALPEPNRDTLVGADQQAIPRELSGRGPFVSASPLTPAHDALPEPRVDIPQPADSAVVDGRTGSCEATERTRPIVPSMSANPAYDALPEADRDLLQSVARELGTHTTLDFGAFATALDRVAKQRGVRLTATLRKQIRDAVATRDETAQPILVKSTQVQPGTEPDRLHGQGVGPRSANVAFINQYEPDPELRDTEQIPLLEPGGIAGFIEREVWPHVPEAWVVPRSERIGYEISFTRHFYKPQPLRTLAEIEADIRALERETDGLLDEILISMTTGGE